MGYEIFEKLCRNKGVRPSDVSRATGISTATLTSWKQGKYTPKADKLQKIADYFSVSVFCLMDDVKESEHQAEYTGYYLNDETARVAQEIFEDRDLRILFDAARDSSPDDLRMAADLLRRLKGDR